MRVWRIGIQHPELLDRIAAVVEGTTSRSRPRASTPAAGTSSIRTPALPPEGLLSVTIAGADLGTADAYATAAFAMGEHGPGWTASLRPYEAFCILADGSTLSTAGFPLAYPSRERAEEVDG